MHWSQPARKQRLCFTRMDYTDIDWPNVFYKLSFLVEELRVRDCQDIDSLVELKEKLDGAVNCLLVLSCDAPSFTCKNVDGLLNQIRMFSQEIHREIIGFRRRYSERLAVFGLNLPLVINFKITQKPPKTSQNHPKLAKNHPKLAKNQPNHPKISHKTKHGKASGESKITLYIYKIYTDLIFDYLTNFTIFNFFSMYFKDQIFKHNTDDGEHLSSAK